MSSSYINTQGGSSGLPIPKLRLNSFNQADVKQTVSIKKYDYANNASSGSFELVNFPEIITTDLTDEQIAKGVYVEMLHYSKGKSNADYIYTSGITGKTYKGDLENSYKVPISWIGGVNLFDGKWTRGGRCTVTHLGGVVDLTVDRPNHYKVSAHNEVIPVWKYLNNRLCEIKVNYRDVNANITALNCVTPVAGLANYPGRVGRHFGYSAKLRSYYICCLMRI